MYTWGASPQVLRLQIQAQKKSKILEYQAAAEKYAEAEFESQNAPNNDETGKVTKVTDDSSSVPSYVRIAPSHHSSQAIGAIPINLQKRLSDNIVSNSSNLRDLNVGFFEEAQTHMKPVLVDTSLVNGGIVQVTRYFYTRRKW